MKKLLCFGDSNTYGYRPYDGRWAEDIRWTGRLAAALAPEWQVIEAGLNGRSVGSYDQLWPEKNGKDIIRSYISKYAPLDLLLVMLGSNDALFAPTADIAADMEELILNARSALGGSACPILLLAPSGGWNKDVRLLAPEYRRLAEKHGLLFADTALWQAQLSEDGCHLSAEGHACLARNILEIIGTQVK